MSYSSTRKWESTAVIARRERQQRQTRINALQRNVDALQRDAERLERRRQKLCPKSAAWTENMDIFQHQRAFSADEALRRQRQINREREVSYAFHIHMPVRPAFGGKQFDNNRSTVLSVPTVFTPLFELGRDHPVAPWPPISEVKYEGDERIRTDKLHGRFLGAPRVPGNDTVNWQHRSMVPQYAFENFHYPIPNEDDIFLRNYYIPELEICDEEGRWMVGDELMDIFRE